MAENFALTNCGQVATCSDAGVIEDATVLVSHGVIAAVSKGQSVPQGVETIDIGGRVVTPGLIDAHTRAVFAGSRVDEYEMRAKGASYQEIASAGGGIKATMQAVRMARPSLGRSTASLPRFAFSIYPVCPTRAGTPRTG